MPLDSGQSLQFNKAEGPDFQLVNTVVGKFASAHPYLLFDRRAIGRIRKRASANSKLVTRLQQSLREEDPAAPGQDLRTRIKRRSRRLIHIAFLSLIGDRTTSKDALHATRSLLSVVAAEESWRARPVIKSFLDSSEIAVAVALAYDWLYEALSHRERRAVEQALFRHVIEPALAAYADRFMLWPKRRDNCALVSNSGILVAALAVLGIHRDASRLLIEHSLASSWRIFETLAPDGGWAEGPSYWSLAMRYAGLMVAALESTFGQSFGLADRPGLAQTGDFALHTVGTFGVAFNFGDSHHGFDVSPLAWFAHRFKRPSDARLIKQYDGWYLPFTAIWADRPKTNAATAPPTGKVFHSSSLACFRNTWSSEPGARPVYLAIKGGNVSGTETGSSRPEDVLLHAQADAGSFIIDGARRRWIMDLGPDDYDLPGYFDHGADNRSGLRWRYYRTQTAGHNTLVIDGRNQIPNARAPIVGSCIDRECKWAVFDLSAAYGKPPGAVLRGAALIGRQVVIQDEVDTEVSGTIAWVAHTTAEPVSVAGSVARFRSGSDRFVVSIVEPSTAYFDLGFPPEPHSFPIVDIRQLHGRPVFAGNNPQVSEMPRRADACGRLGDALIRRLQIVWPNGVRRLTVALLPDYDDNADFAAHVTPLEEWLARSPVRLARYRRPRQWIAGGGGNKGVAPMKMPALRAGVVRKQLFQRIGHA